MYSNLKSVMGRDNVTMESLSRILKTHRNTIGNKVNGETAFSAEEAILIWETHFKQYDFMWLFKRCQQTEKTTA